MSEVIEVFPSFPVALEREAGCIVVKRMSFKRRVIGWVSGPILVVFAIIFTGILFSNSTGAAKVYGVLIGWFAGTFFYLIHARLQWRSLREAQDVARRRAGRIFMRFSEKGMEMGGGDFDSSYQWSAVDEIVALRHGTGIRVGAWVFPVADVDLPDRMNSLKFRERLELRRTGA